MEHEERMRVVMQEVERARRETATALAKAAADKRAGDHRERASAKETAAAKASARALSDRLRFLALECVVMQRPKLERQRRLVMSWTRWCKNVYGSGSVRSSVIATGAEHSVACPHMELIAARLLPGLAERAAAAGRRGKGAVD